MDSIIFLGCGKGAIFSDLVLETILNQCDNKKLLAVSGTSCAAAGLLIRDKETLFSSFDGKIGEAELNWKIEKGIKQREEIPHNLKVVGADLKRQSPVIFKSPWEGEKTSLLEKDIALSQVYLKAFLKPYKSERGELFDGALIPYGCFFPLSFLGAKESLFVFFPCEKPKNYYEMTVNFLGKQCMGRGKKAITIFSPEEENFRQFEANFKMNLKKLNV